MENNSQLSEKTGLLNRAQNILAKVTPAFKTWAKRNGFVRAAIMSPLETSDGRFYYVTDSYEMKAESMAKFYASKEFWQETLSRAFEWQCFSYDFNELEKFHQFFDEDFFARINKIFFLPFGDIEKPNIFFTVELEDEPDLTLDDAPLTAVHLKNIKEFQNLESKIIEKLEKNIDSGLEISNARLFILSLKNWIENAIKGIDFENDELKNAVIEAITNAACTNISPLIRAPNCIHNGKNGEIKIALFAKEDPNEELVAHHISRALENFLGKYDEKSKATFLPAGYCPNKKGTIAFLTKD